MRLAAITLPPAACVLFFTLAWELDAFSPPGEPLPPPHARSAAAKPADAAPSDDPAAWVETILARPLFSPSRRPMQNPTATAQAADQTDGLPRLAGIMTGPFGRAAIFAPDGGKPMVIDEGSRVNAWTVHQVRTDEVELEGPGGTRILRINFHAPSPSAGEPAVTGQRIGLSSAR